MIIKKYGIELQRLTAKDIELVRQHRNSAFIKAKMFYQETITESEQKTWFNSIDNDLNYYFLIIYKNEKVGLIHGKIESFENKTSEGGIFIWKKNILNTHIPVIASICMNDLSFLIMTIEQIKVKVKKDNSIALNYNLNMGFRITEEPSEKDQIVMTLSKEDYFLNFGPTRKLIQKISDDFSDLSWDDIYFPKKISEHLYKSLPSFLKHKVERKLDKL